MIAIATIAVLLSYVVTAYLEARHYHYARERKFFLPWEHTLLTIQRSVIWILFWLATNQQYLFAHFWYYMNNCDWYAPWIYLIQTMSKMGGLILIFPLIHDGLYYYFRNELKHKIYKRRFADHSKEDTAFIRLPFPERIALAVFGIFFFWI